MRGVGSSTAHRIGRGEWRVGGVWTASARVAVREVESDKPYRRVAYEPLVEPNVDEADAATLRPALQEAIADRVRNAPELPDELPIGVLADVLMMSLDLEHDARQALYAESDPGRRARGALAAHAGHEGKD